MSEYRRHFADPLDFFKRRCRKASYHGEWTAGATLYALYRRWAFLSDCDANRISLFYSKLNKKYGKHRREQHGVDLWPLWVRVALPKAPAEPVARIEPPPPTPVQRGLVKVIGDMAFCDGLLAAGQQVPWMEPTKNERHYLDLEYRRQQEDGVKQPSSWLIIVFAGKRRRVPADTVTKVI